MQIPERVRDALLRIGLSAADWREVRTAFSEEPDRLTVPIFTPNPAPAADDGDGWPAPEVIDDLDNWWLRKRWQELGRPGATRFAQAIGVSTPTALEVITSIETGGFIRRPRVGRPRHDMAAQGAPT